VQWKEVEGELKKEGKFDYLFQKKELDDNEQLLKDFLQKNFYNKILEGREDFDDQLFQSGFANISDWDDLKGKIQKWYKKRPDYDNESKRVLMKLAMPGKDHHNSATEIIVNFVKKHEIIVTSNDNERQDMYVYEDGVYTDRGYSKIKEHCRKLLGEAYRDNIIRDVTEKIKVDTQTDINEFLKKEEKEKVCCQNGIIDLKSGQFEPHTSKYVFFNKIPIKYDPEADCPNVRSFMSSIVSNPAEDLDIIQELLGYCLLKNYKIPKAIMLSGSGRNGKGTLMQLIRHFVGVENTTDVSLHALENDQYAASELCGRLVCCSGDLDTTALKHTGMFKQLTGGDDIYANRKYRQPIKFKNYAKLIFAANQIPETRDLSPAFFSRWVIIDFPYAFYSKEEIDEMSDEEKRNKKIADREIVDRISTEKELSGMLNWGLVGLKNMLKQGNFSHSQTTKEVYRRWVRKSDSTQAFIDEFVRTDYDAWVSKEDFRKALSKFCQYHKLVQDSEPIIKRKLQERLGVIDERKTCNYQVVRTWSGIDIKWDIFDLKTPKKIDTIEHNSSGSKDNVLTGMSSMSGYSEKSLWSIPPPFFNYPVNPDNPVKIDNLFKKEGVVFSVFENIDLKYLYHSIKNWLKNNPKSTIKEYDIYFLFSILWYSRDSVQKVIEKLLVRGEIYSPRSGLYQNLD